VRAHSSSATTSRRSVEAYLATLQRLRALVETVEHVVPGHGPMLDRERALRLLDEDGAYVQELRDRGADAQLPAGRRTRSQQRNHARNVAGLAP
jgi:glyoxylase-like metal-dependent hydrolase (beta-lactamase superfamily II)